MSAEGNNNLDNDAAADLLHSISEELYGSVIELLQHPHGHEYDDELISELFVRIEMIFALHDHAMIHAAPQQHEVGALIDPFMQRWQDFHIASGHEPPLARKRSMEDTFARLLAVVREVHQDSPNFEPVEIDWETDDLSPEHRMVKDLFEGVERRAARRPDPD